MVWETLRGHQQQIDMFRQSFGHGRMSHAYLFVGPDGIGKRQFARKMSQCLFCESHTDEELLACGQCSGCKQFAAGTHPDFFQVGKPEGKAELTIDVFLGPRERRGREGLCYELSLRPMASNRKLAIIDDADSMNDKSANALLKTLEEPPQNSMLILIAANSESVLPTIRSRCQFVRFSPLGHENLVSILLEQNMVADQAEAVNIAELSDGSVTSASQLLDPEIRTIRDRIIESVSAVPFNSLSTSAAMIKSVEELGGNTGAQRQNAILLSRFLIEFYRQCMVSLASNQPTTTPAVSAFVNRLSTDNPDDSEKIAAMIERTMECEVQLNRVMPFALCFESLCESLGRIQRS